MNINIYTFKEPEEYGGQWGATTTEKPFDGISAFDDTELGAVKEFCVALIDAIEVEMESSDCIKKTWQEELPHIKYVIDSLHAQGLCSGILPEIYDRLKIVAMENENEVV